MAWHGMARHGMAWVAMLRGHNFACFRTCDLLAQMSEGAALCCTSTRQRCRPQTNLATVRPRLARTALERESDCIVFLGSKHVCG